MDRHALSHVSDRSIAHSSVEQGRLRVALTLVFLVSLAGCAGCPPPTETDAGVDAGIDAGPGPGEPEPSNDGGSPEPEGDASVGPLCDENVEGYGEVCAAQQGDPLCGEFLCNPQTDELFCYDPQGPNACGGCEELDLSEGRVGETCGEFGCGTIVCEDEVSTRCEGDHPRNQCGGCADILPASRIPGDTCSICETGTQTCTRDENDMLCVAGRAPNNACGGCDRCVLAHAFMDDRFNGGFVRTGTTVLIEDIGNGTTHLVFDPLIEGDGTAGLVLARVFLSNKEDPTELGSNAAQVAPDFAQALDGITADPIRQFIVPSIIDPGGYRYVVIFDLLFQNVISVGQLRAGSPPAPGVDGGVVDGGPQSDGGVDDGGPQSDAGVDGGVADGGTADGGIVDSGLVDSGVADGGVDAGTIDSGLADAGVVDAGATDAGATDAG